MRILGLQGSPRRNGNTHYLLSTFMAEAEKLGALTQTVTVDKKNILPCREYVVCEKKGFCPIEDDMNDVYALLRWADVVVVASPVFFYNVTAQLKALIDRCQTLWARKYRLKLKDPGAATRLGVILAVGATQGKSLFDGVHLTTKYFFDAVDAKFQESLEYRGIEHHKDMAAHPTALQEIRECTKRIVSPFASREKILFISRKNASRSQMAAAFARILGGGRVAVYTGGIVPAEKIDPRMETVMAEKGIDMAFRRPQRIETAMMEGQPSRVISVGQDAMPFHLPGTDVDVWDIQDPAEVPLEMLRIIRDDIAKRVAELIGAV